MPQQDLSHWLGLSIVFKNKTDLTTETLDFTNKPYLIGDPNLYDASIYPLIISGTKMGTVSDGQSVLPDSGSIRLLNSIGSFGVDRKLSDILERYEIVDQQATLTYGTSDIEALVPETSVTGYLLKVLDWTHVIDQDEPAIEIRLDAKKIPKRIINARLNSTMFSAIPAGSVNKYIPVVFGSDVQVKPIIVDPSANNPVFAYATILNNEHPVGGVQAYYAKDNIGQYRAILSGAVNVASFSESATATVMTLSGGEKAFKLKAASETTRNYILTHVAVKFGGHIVGSYDGVFTATVYTSDNIQVGAALVAKPGSALANGVNYGTDFNTEFGLAADFNMRFSLSKPVVLSSDAAYWIGIKHDAVLSSSPNVRVTATGSNKAWTRVTDWVPNSTNYQVDFSAYSVEFSDVTTSGTVDPLTGLACAYLNTDQSDPANPSYVNNPDISKLDLILSIDGLKDDSSGTITGSANSLIETIHHAIKLMSQTWSGSAWSLDTTNWDFSTYADTYFSTNTIAGCTDGEFTLEQLLRQICRNSATKLVMLSSGKIAPYSWGTTRTSAATFDQENSKLIRFETSDASYVINRATIACGRGLVYYDSLIADTQGIPADYTLVYRFNNTYSAEYTTLIGTSESLYGARELADIYFNWIGSLSTAERAARHLLTNFNQPVRYVEVEAPYNEFATLEPMAVVTIINPSLPNYYGGIPNAKLPHYLGDEVDPLAGYNLCEAQSYRAQIEGKTLTYNEDSAPTLNLICRLLTNYPNDPT